MRDKRGRWQKGMSGNPSGYSSRAARLREMLGDESEEVAATVLELAKTGDMTACTLILERIVPPTKPTMELVAFDLDPEAPLADQGRAVLAAVAVGQLPPDQGGVLLQNLTALARLVDVDEFERRLAALEKGAGIEA